MHSSRIIWQNLGDVNILKTDLEIITYIQYKIKIQLKFSSSVPLTSYKEIFVNSIKLVNFAKTVMQTV